MSRPSGQTVLIRKRYRASPPGRQGPRRERGSSSSGRPTLRVSQTNAKRTRSTMNMVPSGEARGVPQIGYSVSRLLNQDPGCRLGDGISEHLPRSEVRPDG